MSLFENGLVVFFLALQRRNGDMLLAKIYVWFYVYCLLVVSGSRFNPYWENFESTSMRWDNAMSKSTVSGSENFNYAHSHVMRQLCARLWIMATRYDNAVVREWTRFGFICLDTTKRISGGNTDDVTRCVYIVDKISKCVRKAWDLVCAWRMGFSTPYQWLRPLSWCMNHTKKSFLLWQDTWNTSTNIDWSTNLQRRWHMCVAWISVCRFWLSIICSHTCHQHVSTNAFLSTSTNYSH